MKKFVSKLLISVMLIMMLPGILVQASEITVFVDGEQVYFDQPPVIENGRTLVPVRAISEKLGATVEWNDTTRTAAITGGQDVVTMTIDNSTITKNGFNIKIDQPPVIYGSRTLIPARALAEGLDCRVEWNQELYRVDITKVTDDGFDALESFMAENGVKTNNAYFISCPAEVLTDSPEYKGIIVNMSCLVGTNCVKMWYSDAKEGKSGTITFYRGSDDYTFEAAEKFNYIDTVNLLLKKDAYLEMPKNLSLSTGNIAKGCGITQEKAEEVATESLETALMLFDTFLSRVGASVTIKDLGFINVN